MTFSRTPRCCSPITTPCLTSLWAAGKWKAGPWGPRPQDPVAAPWESLGLSRKGKKPLQVSQGRGRAGSWSPGPSLGGLHGPAVCRLPAQHLLSPHGRPRLHHHLWIHGTLHLLCPLPGGPLCLFLFLSCLFFFLHLTGAFIHAPRKQRLHKCVLMFCTPSCWHSVMNRIVRLLSRLLCAPSRTG